jgi:hypothetical protein
MFSQCFQIRTQVTMDNFLGANHVQVTSRYLSFHRATQPVTAEVSQRVVHGSQENEPKQKKAVARTLRIRDTWVCLKIPCNGL